MAQQEAHPFSIVLADTSAVGHFNAGLELYRQLEEAAHEQSGEGNLDFSRTIELAVPAVTNLALGLELLLKAYHFVAAGSYPKGHDVQALAAALPKAHFQRIEAHYSSIFNDPNVNKGIELRFSGGPNGYEQKKWTAPDYSTFVAALSYIGPMYVQWRYIYEEMGGEVDIGVAFAPLYFSGMAVRQAIRENRGNTKVSIDATPSAT